MRQAQFKAEISLFLALITAILISLIFTVVESARTQAAKTYLALAADSAIDSLFSQYHLELWEHYRLLGVEMYSVNEVAREYSDFIKPYMNGDETSNWYCLSAGEEDVSVNEYQLLTDGNGAVFEEQVRAYMACGMVLDLAGLDSSGQIEEQAQTAKQVGEMADELESGSREARKLNEYLEDLEEIVQEHNRKVSSAKQALESGSNVTGSLNSLKQQAEKAAKKLEQVRTAAVRLEAKVEDTREKLKAKQAAGELTAEALEILNGQLENYESYSSGQGNKKRELDSLEEKLNENLDCLERVLAEAEAAQEYIRTWSPAQIIVGYKNPEKEGDKPIPIYEDETLDTNAVWQPVRESFSDYVELNFQNGDGEIDREKSGKLDSAANLLKGNVLKLVYPEYSDLSKTELDLNRSPSSLYLEKKNGLFSSEDYTLNRLAVDEYATLELSHVLDKDQTGAAEIEYVICGNKTDEKNVSALASELVALRTGLNLTYLIGNAECMEAVSALALAITGNPPAALIAETAILLTWAGAQAVLDVRDLYSGGKVPFMHSASTFRLTLEGLLGGLPGLLNGEGICRTGLDYEAYLRICLGYRSGSLVDYRIMDIIQANLRKEQSDFRMERLYTAAEITVNADSVHLFSRWNSSGNALSLGNSRYSVTATSYCSY